jgi:hypothetical protein
MRQIPEPGAKADERRRSDRRTAQDPDYRGTERRTADRRTKPEN